ncbi:MAG: condensation domain-containing protein [Carboxylicivirga sp.]|jgi:hypothetical protein|nr:condensation domain-containing protein [Carboxylicivirga sp.]
MSKVSLIQKQFLFNSLLYPKDTSQHIVSIFKIDGYVDICRLENALNKLIKQHAILHTVFNRKGKEFDSSIIDAEEVDFKVNRIDKKIEFLGILPDEIYNDIHKPFNVSEWPLIRVKIWEFANNISIMTIVFHHAIIDLHSKNIFQSFLSRYYNNQIDNENEEVDFETVYSDYAKAENDWLNTAEAGKMIRFWQNYIGTPEKQLPLPTDHQRPGIRSKQGKRIFFSFSNEDSTYVLKYAKDNLVDVFTVLLSAYGTLLRDITGQNDVTIGVPFSNRRKEINKQVFGPVLNILPLKIDLTEDNARNLIQQVRKTMLMAHRNQELPFLYLLDHLQYQKSFSSFPVFQVGFTREDEMELSFNDLIIESIPFEREGAQLDIFLTYWLKENKIHGYFEYASDLFNVTTIEQWIQQYKNILITMAWR